MQHSGLISAPNELPLLIAGIIQLVELRGQYLFEEQLRAGDTRNIRRASGLVLADYPGV